MAKTDILFSRKSLCYSIFSYRIFLVRFQLNEIYELCACQVKCSHWIGCLVVLLHSDNNFFRNWGEFHFGKENSCRCCEWSHHCSQGLRYWEAHFYKNSCRLYNRDCEHDYTPDNIHRFCFNPCIRHACLWPVHHRSRLNSFPHCQILLDLFRTIEFRSLDWLIQESPAKARHRLPRDECDEVRDLILCNYSRDPCRCVFHCFKLAIVWYLTANSPFFRVRWELLYDVQWGIHKLCS